MQKYLFYGNYTPAGYKGLLVEGGTKRYQAVKQALKSVGGSLKAFYFSFGEKDFYVIVDLPDNISASAFTLTANFTGAFNMKTVVLLTPEEIDEAIKKSVDYRPPGHK